MDLISRQAAIERFDYIRPRDPMTSDYTHGIDVGIALCKVAIREQPPAQLGTNSASLGTDCISRRKAIDALDKRFDSVPMEQTTEILMLRKDLRELPPAQPQRTGKWIRNGWAITCSECGYDMPYTVRNFCPNCGAKMEGDAE